MSAERTKLGTELTPEEQQRVLSQYVHRFTGDHKPQWAEKPMPNGQAYQVQFASDRDWLAHTRFKVLSSGRLDNNARWCASSPTWPNKQKN